MLAPFVLAIAQAGSTVPLTLATDQESLYVAHAKDFPKVGWVVAKKVPVSNSTQLGGKLIGVLPVGTQVEIAGLAGLVASSTTPGAMDEVVAIPLGTGEIRSAGYLRARGVAIVETALGRTAGGTFVFATVVGRRLVANIRGMVLDVEVWAKPAGEPPRLVLSGPNVGPRLAAMAADRLAVSLAGTVVVLEADGSEMWRSPSHEAWSLVEAADSSFVVMGPDGSTLTVPEPKR